MRPFSLLALVSTCTGAAFGAWAAPGDLDPVFGTNGMVRLDALDDGDAPGSLVIQPDGKLLVSRTVGVWRLNPDGTLDQTFGVSGRALSPFPNSASGALLVLADGKIATGGALAHTSPNSRTGLDYYNLVVTRLLSDGRVDLAFGSVGQAEVDFSFDDAADAEARALLEQRDGKIVAAGSVGYMGCGTTAVSAPPI